MAFGRSCCPALRRWLSPEFFRALGDPNRLAVLIALADDGHEKTVTQLASCCPVDLSVVSRHLRILRDAKILEARKRGKEVLYRVRFDVLVQTLRSLADALEGCCPPAASASSSERHRSSREGA
jgi:DNA-binding transcriptional ArsR family regulator